MDTSRQWIVALEKGAPSLRLGLVMNRLAHVGLLIDIQEDTFSDQFNTPPGLERATP